MLGCLIAAPKPTPKGNNVNTLGVNRKAGCLLSLSGGLGCVLGGRWGVWAGVEGESVSMPTTAHAPARPLCQTFRCTMQTAGYVHFHTLKPNRWSSRPQHPESRVHNEYIGYQSLVYQLPGLILHLAMRHALNLGDART